MSLVAKVVSFQQKLHKLVFVMVVSFFHPQFM